MSASRQSLGNDWRPAFLRAPIWRFWLGETLCGTTVLGAFMPSLDQVGRYFPLTVFACADEGEAIPPPELNQQADWFATTENFLLSTLDHDVTYETIVAGLDQLPAPLAENPAADSPDLVTVPQGMVAPVGAEQSFCDVFASMRVANHAKAYGSSSFWWTIGGDGFRPLALSARNMPDPFLFTEMLTGRFSFSFT
jgi:type VI secretion system protein ImpM